MTEKYIKEQFRMYKNKKIQIQIWNECLKSTKDQEQIEGEKEKIKLQLDILYSCLEILSDKDKFILTEHLVNHCTWSELVKLCEEKWGRNESRSERTLKRMQQNAIRQIMDFIRQSKLESFLGG